MLQYENIVLQYKKIVLQYKKWCYNMKIIYIYIDSFIDHKKVYIYIYIYKLFCDL